MIHNKKFLAQITSSLTQCKSQVIYLSVIILFLCRRLRFENCILNSAIKIRFFFIVSSVNGQLLHFVKTKPIISCDFIDKYRLCQQMPCFSSSIIHLQSRCFIKLRFNTNIITILIEFQNKCFYTFLYNLNLTQCGGTFFPVGHDILDRSSKFEGNSQYYQEDVPLQLELHNFHFVV